MLGRYATDVKSNEITAIPELLKLLDLKGAVVSVDAMGCQKNIARVIRDRGADYVFGLKGNHPTLHREVLDSFDAVTCAKLAAFPQSFAAAADKGHGRNEYRSVWVQRDIDWLTRSEAWSGLKTLVLVQSERTVRGVSTCERRAYISSLDAKSAESSVRLGHSTTRSSIRRRRGRYPAWSVA